MLGCPGVPFQQLSNFVVGTKDALCFFTSTPKKRYRNPQGAVADTVNPYWSSSTARATVVRRPRAAPRRSRSSGTRWGRRRSRRCRPPTSGSRPSWRSTSSPALLARCPRRQRQHAGRARAGRAVGVRLHRQPLASQRRLVAAPQPSPEAPTRCVSAPPASTRGDGRRRLDARRAPRVHPPRLHRHPARAAGQPLRPGPDQRLRAALARPLPQAPRHGQASAQAVLPLPRARRRWRVVARAAPAGPAAELLLLLGLLAGLASTATSATSAAEPARPPASTEAEQRAQRASTKPGEVPT